MDTIRSALLGQLEQTIERLNGLGGAVVFEAYPGAVKDEGQGEAGGDAASISGEWELRPWKCRRPIGYAPCPSRGYGPQGRDHLGSRVFRGS